MWGGGWASRGRRVVDPYRQEQDTGRLPIRTSTCLPPTTAHHHNHPPSPTNPGHLLTCRASTSCRQSSPTLKMQACTFSWAPSSSACSHRNAARMGHLAADWRRGGGRERGGSECGDGC